MSKHVTKMTLYDAEHYSDAQRDEIIASYPEFERKARVYGEPSVGEGRIFPIPEEAIRIDPFRCPDHWPQIAGLDFGWDHPTAAVHCVWDREADCFYITTCYRVRQQTPMVHAATLKAWGQGLPWVWPHDGLQHDKGSGQQLAGLYRSQGLAMATSPVMFEDGGNSVEAGLLDMLQRMQSGRLKVFASCQDWFEEFRLYHRKAGQVVKLHDDLLSATRYALMGKRFAQSPAAVATRNNGAPLNAQTFNPFEW